MKKSRTLRQVVVALALLVAFLSQATWVLAGTTGSLSGVVTDENGAPIAGAAVKASSPSQTVATTTDAGGHFSFLSLAPDTYSVSVTKDQYNPNSQSGVTIFADQSFTLSFRLTKGMKTIAQVSARAAGNLVKPGTTSDVYSVNAATQQTVQGIGGGYNLDSAYSAIYSQPGVTSQIGNYGFGQVYYIRGSSYSQVGYEYDGVPVNRAFDNYNANSLSSLGAQETEVYTGGSPAGGASATLAGYINQVIKTGTFPGFAQGSLGVGYPAFYHKAGVEAGGATPDRLFSWYVGVQGSNQSYQTMDNNNGVSQPIDGSGPNGIFSSPINSITSLFATYTNGPWSTCAPSGASPAGAASYSGLPTCQVYTPWSGTNFLGLPVETQDRENVVNFHFGIPHHGDAGKDDVQALYYNFAYHQYFGDSIQDMGGLGYLNTAYAGWKNLAGAFGITNYNGSTGPYADLCGYQAVFAAFGIFRPGSPGCATTGGSTLPYVDSYIFAPGTRFGQNAATATVIPYGAPSQPAHAQFAGVPVNGRDTTWNDGSVIKLQYQKNIGSNAYVRLMGYTFYSDWLMSSPNFGNYAVTGYGYGNAGYGYPSGDYELNTHTRGVQLMAADQINAQNLLQFTGNYTTASVVRWNNQWYSSPTGVTNFVGPGNNCYTPVTITNSTGAVVLPGGAQTSCYSSLTSGSYGQPGYLGNPTFSRNGTVNALCAPGSGYTCTPFTAPGYNWEVTVPQGYGTLNTVQPQFASVALQDEWRPSDRWDINAGVRFESYVYNLANSNNAEYNFWFQQAQNNYCYDPKTGQPILTPVTPSSPPGNAGPVILPNQPGSGETPGLCYNSPTSPYISPSGAQARHPNGQNGSMLYSNIGPSGFSHPLWSPRIGGTYTFSPDTVVRFNYGRFTQPTETAFEQYLNASGYGAAKFDFQRFWGLGFTTPAHNNPVQVSNNYDLSLEQHLKGTDMSFKVSPFYRWTTNQLVTVSLGGNFASGINAATQQTYGVEFSFQKGDPTRNGFSGQFNYTYTNAKMKFYTLANGSNAIDVINNYIKAFNALTKAGGGSPWYCANAAGGPNGTNPGASSPTACSQYSRIAPNHYITPIANPYYNDSLQSILDRNGWYNPYANNPPQGSPDQIFGTAISPNVFASFVNYKHDRFTATLTGQLNQGYSYGSPLSVVGLDPRSCSANQKNVPGAGAAFAGYANYQSCAFSAFVSSGYLAIPNPQTGHFDQFQGYQQPWQLNLGAQVAYDITPKIRATVTFANIVNTCFGGSPEPWTAKYQPNNIVCGYSGNGYYYVGNQPGAGFFYGNSPGSAANGTAGYPAVFNQSYQPVIGALPFQVYGNVTIKL